jgi:hypothetical protein
MRNGCSIRNVPRVRSPIEFASNPTESAPRLASLRAPAVVVGPSCGRLLQRHIQVIKAGNRPRRGWGCLLGPESCAPKAAGRGRGGFTGGVPTSVSGSYRECRSCKRDRYAPPVHLIKLTATQRSRRSSGCIRMDAGPRRPACPRARPRRRQSGSASGFTPDEAIAEMRDVLASIGDTCPECPPDCGRLRAAPRPKNRRAAYRAYSVGSDGHFVGFEPLTWQLHRDHPPPARPPSLATATRRPR